MYGDRSYISVQSSFHADDMKRFVFGVVLASLALSLSAQSPSFEVATIKPNRSGDGPAKFGLPPGRFVATNASLREIIRSAYQVSDFQLVNAPDWTSSERFDVEAIITTSSGDKRPMALGAGGPPPQLFVMLRALLVDRFKLAVRSEKREVSVYALVFARKDKRLGPAIAPTTIDCAALAAAALANLNAPPTTSRPGQPRKCGVFGAPGRFEGWATTLAEFGQTLTQLVGRTVVDETGLSARFDFTLMFTPQLNPPDQSPTASSDPALPLASALEEQLGLKLRSTKAPVDVIVIDHVEHPSSD